MVSITRSKEELKEELKEEPEEEDEPFDLRPGETEREAKIRREVEKLKASFTKGKTPKLPAPVKQLPRKPGIGKLSVGEAPKRQVLAATQEVGVNPYIDVVEVGVQEVETVDHDESNEQGFVADDDEKIEQDGAMLDELLPRLEQKVAHVVDSADKISLVAAPLQMEATPELRDLQLTAVRDTERAVKASTGLLMHARREIDKTYQQAANFALVAKEQATEALQKMTARLDAAAVTIQEYTNARQDFDSTVNASKSLVELASRVATVEMESEKAAMMAEPLQRALDGDAASAEAREAREVVRIAEAMVGPVLRLITSKVKSVKGPVKKQLELLQARMETAQVNLQRAKKTLDEAQGSFAVLPVIKQVEERAAKVEQALVEMRESETPFLMGLETVPADEAKEVLDQMEQASTAASNAIEDTKKFLALKVVELGRLTTSSADDARASIEEVKKHLEEGTVTVRKFQAEMLTRQKGNDFQVLQARMQEAAEAVKKVTEAHGTLQKARGGTVVSDILAQARISEEEAKKRMAAARQQLQSYNQHKEPPWPKPNADPRREEVARTKTALGKFDVELNKFYRLAKDVEEDLRVQKELSEVGRQLKDVEEETQRLAKEAPNWVAGEVDLDVLSLRCADVDGKLGVVAEEVERRSHAAQGLELKELRKAFHRLQQAHSNFDSVKAKLQVCSQAASARVVEAAVAAVAEVEAKVNAMDPPQVILATMEPEAVLVQHGQMLEARQLMHQAYSAVQQVQQSSLALETKVEFARVQLRWKALERRWQAISSAVGSTFDKVATEAAELVIGCLRKLANTGSSMDSQGLFTAISGGQREVTEDQFSDFVCAKKASEVALSIAQVSLAFRKFASLTSTLTLARLTELLESYYRCVRPVALTDKFDIQLAKKVCMLQSGSIIEGMGEPLEDTSLGLLRLPCRVVGDALEGWVTLRSKAGAEYAVRVDSGPSSEPPAKRMKAEIA